MDVTLADMGERAIVREILAPRYQHSSFAYGSDCASIRWPQVAGWLVATTDPCPPPAAAILGYDDPYYYGWLLATINLSDLAAAGAAPLGLLTSLQLPRETTVHDFLRLLDGIDDCCQSVGTSVIGGNLKEAGLRDISATALGVCDSTPLTRTGAQTGDDVYAAGGFGAFWASFVAESRFPSARAELLDSLRPAVLQPTPEVRLGEELRKTGIATSCIDNSDGLLPSVELLGSASEVAIALDVGLFVPDPLVIEVAELASVAWWRFALGWGDWNLIFTAAPKRAAELRSIAADAGVRLSQLGRVEAGVGVTVRLGDEHGLPMRLESERFASDSWFHAGIESYVNTFLQAPLIRSPGQSDRELRA